MKIEGNKVLIDGSRQSISEANDNKYGVPVTFRISAEMKKELGDEAALRGISLAQHGADLLLTCHKKGADRTAEINLLIQERDYLKQKIETLQREKIVFQNTQGRVLEVLRKNQQILKHFQPNKFTPKSSLSQAGFDFCFVTHTGLEADKQFFCVFDMAYRLEGDSVIIKPIS